MKRSYLEPTVTILHVATADILAASDEEVFVDGGDLFD